MATEEARVYIIDDEAEVRESLARLLASAGVPATECASAGEYLLCPQVAGRLNKQIAGDLSIAEKTVKVHRGRVMAKMQAKSLAELVHLCDELAAAGAYTH